MKRLHIVSFVLVAFFVTVPTVSFAQGIRPMNLNTIPKAKTDQVVTAPKKGIVIEESPGVPLYWEVFGEQAGPYGDELVIRPVGSDTFDKLRYVLEDDFIIVPSKGQKFKLAQINGTGKYLPVDLVNVSGQLRWIVVD